MARYIDAEKLCKSLRDMAFYQNPYKQSTILGVVSSIENFPTADVAPKSEVERLQAEVDRLLELVGTIPPDRVEFVSRTEINAIKDNLAREIINEIAEYAKEDKSLECSDFTKIGYLLAMNYILKVLIDLKKKYTGEQT